MTPWVLWAPIMTKSAHESAASLHNEGLRIARENCRGGLQSGLSEIPGGASDRLLPRLPERLLQVRGAPAETTARRRKSHALSFRPAKAGPLLREPQTCSHWTNQLQPEVSLFLSLNIEGPPRPRRRSSSDWVARKPLRRVTASPPRQRSADLRHANWCGPPKSLPSKFPMRCPFSSR